MVVILTTFWLLYFPSFFRCLLPSLILEFWNEPFIKSLRLDCSRFTFYIYGIFHNSLIFISDLFTFVSFFRLFHWTGVCDFLSQWFPDGILLDLLKSLSMPSMYTYPFIFILSAISSSFDNNNFSSIYDLPCLISMLRLISWCSFTLTFSYIMKKKTDGYNVWIARYIITHSLCHILLVNNTVLVIFLFMWISA